MPRDDIRLNSAPLSLFERDASESDNTRAYLVAGGRLIMRETAGRESDAFRGSKEFSPLLDDATLLSTGEKHTQKLHLYCSGITAKMYGEAPPASYEEFQRNSQKYLQDPGYLRVLSGVVADIVSPMIPYSASNALGTLAQTVVVPLGKTYEVTVTSNAAIVFQDSSHGAIRSVPSEYLYDEPITINPQLKVASVKIKFYQLVGNGADIGHFYNAIAAGAANKVLAIWSAAMNGAVSNARYVPDYLRFNSYNTANMVLASKAVSQANGVNRKQLMGFGDFSALSRVLPSGTAQDAALTMLLGQEYMSRGFVGTVSGVPLTELTNAYVAGQVNLPAPKEMLTDKRLYITARAGKGHAPIYVCFEDAPISLTIEPNKSADQTLISTMGISLAAAPVFASKIAVIDNV